MNYEDKFRVYGPYKNYKGRKFVIIFDKNNKRRTVSYPKWIMECHLGRELHPDLETVDHWDSNFENNDLSNLRIMPRDEHSANDTRRVKLLKFKCPICKKDFERSPRIIRLKAKTNSSGPFCSKQCSGKYSRLLQLNKIKTLKKQKHTKSEYYKKKYVESKEFIAIKKIAMKFSEILKEFNLI